uniref:Uncharacterized protein n=1 Tax=Glossina brevipalpis TaxID=37001 RepID=A0A1A9X567_9MUSC
MKKKKRKQKLQLQLQQQTSKCNLSIKHKQQHKGEKNFYKAYDYYDVAPWDNESNLNKIRILNEPDNQIDQYETYLRYKGQAHTKAQSVSRNSAVFSVLC